jgi:hypothetical protein
VPTATPSAAVAPDRFTRPTMKVSSGSAMVSPWTRTGNVAVVAPGANVRVPDVGR